MQAKLEARSLLKTIENKRAMLQQAASATPAPASTTAISIDCNEVSMDESDIVLPDLESSMPTDKASPMNLAE